MYVITVHTLEAMEDLLVEDSFEDIFLESALLEPEIDSVCSSEEPRAEAP